MYLLAKIVHLHNKFLNVKSLMLYQTICTKHHLLSENNLKNAVYSVQKMEHKMTLSGTPVNQAMRMLQLQNMTVSQKKQWRSNLIK
jgi:hypothetical protein